MAKRRGRPDCSVMRSLEVVGERWTLLVIREAFFGVRRFEELLANVGCARNLLADRLATLVEHGVLARVPYLDAAGRERFEYRLTEMGKALFPVILSLMEWGDRWLRPEAQAAPVVVRHRGCGEPVGLQLRCAAGHALSGPRDTEATAGPAAPDRTRRKSVRRVRPSTARRPAGARTRRPLRAAPGGSR